MHSRNLDAAWQNRCIHFLTAVLARVCRLLFDAPAVYLWEQVHHLRVQHWREELRVERRVAEALLEAPAAAVCPARVQLCVA